MSYTDKVEHEIDGITFTQEPDCCDSPDRYSQSLTIRFANGGLTKDDRYLVIETERWAIDPDDIDGFCEALKNTMKMRLFETVKTVVTDNSNKGTAESPVITVLSEPKITIHNSATPSMTGLLPRSEPDSKWRTKLTDEKKNDSALSSSITTTIIVSAD